MCTLTKVGGVSSFLSFDTFDNDCTKLERSSSFKLIKLFYQGGLKSAAKDNNRGISLQREKWAWCQGYSQDPGRCADLWEPFFSKKKIHQNKRTYSILMLQAFLLAQCQAEPINGLYTACHQLLQTQPVLSFPALFSPPLMLGNAEAFFSSKFSPKWKKSILWMFIR